jgi:DNA-binding beta-propeller fold protein YncE
VEVQNVSPPVSARTDASGNFVLPNVQQGRQTIVVNKPDYVYLAGTGPVMVNVTTGASVAVPEIDLSPALTAVSNAFIAAIGGLVEPYGLAVDNNHGWLFAVDRIGLNDLVDKRCEVKKFTTAGGFVKRFGGDEVGVQKGTQGAFDLFGHLGWAYGIDVDAGGNVYVADANKDRVVKFNGDGNYVAAAGSGVQNDYDVAVMTNGQVAVSSSGNSKLQLFDANLLASPKALAGTAGTADVNGGYRGLAVDQANFLYVIDNAAGAGGAIKKFDGKAATPVLQFGNNSGNAPSQFRGATDLAIDNRSGDIYVVDAGNNRIQRFDRDGRFVGEFGSAGRGNGQFDRPYGIAIDKDGYVYVSDAGNKRIQKFAPGRVAGGAAAVYPTK